MPEPPIDELTRLRERVAALEDALRAFTCDEAIQAAGQSKGMSWCQSRVTADDMDRARNLL